MDMKPAMYRLYCCKRAELLLREQRMQSPHDVLDVLDHEISYQTRTQGVRTAVLDTRPTNLPFSREQALELRDARKKRSQAVGDDGRRANLQSRDVNRQEQEHPPKEHQRDPTERSFQVILLVQFVRFNNFDRCDLRCACNPPSSSSGFSAPSNESLCRCLHTPPRWRSESGRSNRLVADKSSVI